MEEIWKDIKGYEGLYQISNLGRVKRLKRITLYKVSKICNNKRFIKNIKIEWKEILLKYGKCSNGYLAVILTKDKKIKQKKIHHLVLEAFIGERPKGMECCHKDGNKRNNKIDNLRWDTHLNNIKDRIKHGNNVYGEKHGRHILNEEQVLEIKELLKTNITQTEIAKRYNVKTSVIYSINNKRTWKYLKGK